MALPEVSPLRLGSLLEDTTNCEMYCDSLPTTARLDAAAARAEQQQLALLAASATSPYPQSMPSGRNDASGDAEVPLPKWVGATAVLPRTSSEDSELEVPLPGSDRLVAIWGAEDSPKDAPVPSPGAAAALRSRCSELESEAFELRERLVEQETNEQLRNARLEDECARCRQEAANLRAQVAELAARAQEDRERQRAELEGFRSQLASSVVTSAPSKSEVAARDDDNEAGNSHSPLGQLDANCPGPSPLGQLDANCPEEPTVVIATPLCPAPAVTPLSLPIGGTDSQEQAVEGEDTPFSLTPTTNNDESCDSLSGSIQNASPVSLATLPGAPGWSWPESRSDIAGFLVPGRDSSNNSTDAPTPSPPMPNNIEKAQEPAPLSPSDATGPRKVPASAPGHTRWYSPPQQECSDAQEPATDSRPPRPPQASASSSHREDAEVTLDIIPENRSIGTGALDEPGEADKLRLRYDSDDLRLSDNDTDHVDTDLDLAADHSANERLLTDMEWAEATEAEADATDMEWAAATEAEADAEPEDMDDNTDGMEEPGASIHEEMKRDPDDGLVYTLEELRIKYDGVYSLAELLAYFDHVCDSCLLEETDAEKLCKRRYDGERSANQDARREVDDEDVYRRDEEDEDAYRGDAEAEDVYEHEEGITEAEDAYGHFTEGEDAYETDVGITGVSITCRGITERKAAYGHEEGFIDGVDIREHDAGVTEGEDIYDHEEGITEHEEGITDGDDLSEHDEAESDDHPYEREEGINEEDAYEHEEEEELYEEEEEELSGEEDSGVTDDDKAFEQEDEEEIYARADELLQAAKEDRDTARSRQQLSVSFTDTPPTIGTTSADADWVQISSSPGSSRDLPLDRFLSGPSRSTPSSGSTSVPLRAAPAGGGALTWQGAPCTSPTKRGPLPGSLAAMQLQLQEDAACDPIHLPEATHPRGCTSNGSSIATQAPQLPGHTADLRTPVPQETKVDHCPQGHILQVYINPMTASHNTCNICGRQRIMAPERIYRCYECDYDVCVDCHKASSPSRLSSARPASPTRMAVHGPLSPMRTARQVASLQASPGTRGGPGFLSTPPSVARPQGLQGASNPSGYPQQMPVAAMIPVSTASGANPNEAPALVAHNFQQAAAAATAFRVPMRLPNNGAGLVPTTPLKQRPEEMGRVFPFMNDRGQPVNALPHRVAAAPPSRTSLPGWPQLHR